jgi:hypothetical protein
MSYRRRRDIPNGNNNDADDDARSMDYYDSDGYGYDYYGDYDDYHENPYDDDVYEYDNDYDDDDDNNSYIFEEPQTPRKSIKNIMFYTIDTKQIIDNTVIDCSICLESFEKNKIKTSCNHNFCESCMLKLLDTCYERNTEPKCPNCRAPLEVLEICCSDSYHYIGNHIEKYQSSNNMNMKKNSPIFPEDAPHPNVTIRNRLNINLNQLFYLTSNEIDGPSIGDTNDDNDGPTIW